MTNRNNDDVARALEALSSGEHAEEHAQGQNDHIAHAPTASKPAAPKPAATVKPAAPKPVARPASAPAARSATPATPQAARPGAPGAPTRPAQTGAVPRPTAAARPAQPSTPAASAARPANPSAARPAAARPSAPTARPAAPAARAAAPSNPVAPAPAAAEQAAVDDDAVIVPAPDASVFLHKPNYAAKPKHVPFGQSLRFRQTFIPILLTGGLIMIALGALHFLWHAENNPMGGLPTWLVAVLFLFGLILWGLAFANMMTVKHILAAQERAQT